MDEKYFENLDYGKTLIASMEQALAYEQGDKTKGRTRVYEIPTPAYDGKEIAQLRKTLKVSQAGLALALGVSKRTVESWEAGKSLPNNATNKLLYLVEKDNSIMNKLVIVR